MASTPTPPDLPLCAFSKHVLCSMLSWLCGASSAHDWGRGCGGEGSPVDPFLDQEFKCSMKDLKEVLLDSEAKETTLTAWG